MNRMRILGAVFKWLFLIAFVFSVWFAALTLFRLLQMKPDPHIVGEFWFTPRGQMSLSLVENVGAAVLFWFCYRFFGMCSCREPFTSKNVRYIQAAGCAYFLFFPIDVFRRELEEIYLHAVDYHSNAIIYLPLEWNMHLLGPVIISLFPGMFIIFIAWIMDEGRKIQEEQELTV